MTWLLAILWLLLNLVDVCISWIAVQLGAAEVGRLYQLTPFWTASINKMLLALIIGGVLVYFRKFNWRGLPISKMLLALLTLSMVGLCIYNTWFIMQMRY